MKLAFLLLITITCGVHSRYVSEIPNISKPNYDNQIPQVSLTQTSYGNYVDQDIQLPRAEPVPSNPCTEETMRAAEILLFPNPSDSASYLICTDVDVFISMPCSPGTVFNAQQRHCLPIGYVPPICPVGTCLNQADCMIDERNAFKCICRVGFTGSACEINIDECALGGNQACSAYNGQCIDQINGYYCQWGNEIGLVWENRISNPCTLENTQEKQFFELVSSEGNVYLQCTDESLFIVRKCAEMLFWHQELRTCSIERPLPKTGVCNNYPCKNDGECVDLGGSNFQCLCKSGYTGALCELTINFCSNNPCLNGGRCVSHQTGYNCVCQNNVVDQSCESGVSNPCPIGSSSYFANPLDSAKYFVCSVEGFAFSRNCAQGLIWSQDLLTCKYAIEPVAPNNRNQLYSDSYQNTATVISMMKQAESYGQNPVPQTQTPVQSYGQVTIPQTHTPVQSYGQVKIPQIQKQVQEIPSKSLITSYRPMKLSLSEIINNHRG